MISTVIDTLALARKLRERGPFSAGYGEGDAEVINETFAKNIAIESMLSEALYPIKTDLLLLKWMVGFNSALTIGNLARLFIK